MKSKNISIIAMAAVLLAAGVTVYAADQTARLKKLEADRAIVARKIMDKRLEILTNNEECRALHNQIMALHRELAIKMDANPDMHALNSEAEDIDRLIEEIKAESAK